jgi:hypothetical protein
MEVVQSEHTRARKLVGLLRSLALWLALLFLLLIGSVAYLTKLARDEKAVHSEATSVRNGIVESVTGFGKDMGQMSAKLDQIREASESAAAVMREQADKAGEESKRLDEVLETIRLWSGAESSHVRLALDKWKTRHRDVARELEAAMARAEPAAGTEEEVKPDDDFAGYDEASTAIYGLSARTREALLAAVSKDGTHMLDSRYMGGYDTAGKKDRWGTYLFENGDTYTGEFRGGRKHGRGAYTFRNGDVYIGEYADDVRSGRGTYAAANGDHYVGEFRDGVRNGYGVYTYAKGGKYVGEFMNGQRHGKGYFVDSNGRRVEGLWREDSFVGEGPETTFGRNVR